MMSVPNSRDLNPVQNERLRPIVQKLVKRERSQIKAGDKLGMGQSTISGFLSGRQGTSFTVAVRACRLLGVDPTEVLGEDALAELMKAMGPDQINALTQFHPSDMFVGTFLLKLDRLPGLRSWIEANPTSLSVMALMRGMKLYEEVRPASRDDGEPLNGWGAFFQDALSGRLTRDLPGAGDKAEELELDRMSPSGRKRVRAAPKKP